MIDLRPSHINITNYNKSSKLEKSLSVWNPATFSISFTAMYLDDDLNLVVPGGYDLAKLRQILPSHKVVDNRKKHSRFLKMVAKLKFKPRTKMQENALHFLKGDTRFFGYAVDETQKMLCLKTGEGKTFCSIAYIISKEKMPLIIVDMDKLTEQWKEEFLKFTDIKEEEIFTIAGASSIKKLQKLPFMKHKYKVFIAMHRTLAAHGKNNPYNIDKLFKHLGIGIKVIDEAHVEWGNTFLIDAVTNISETLYLTATPSRSNQSENVVYQNMYGDIVSYGLEHKYKEKYQTIIYTSWNSHPSLDVQSNMKTRNYGFNINGYSDYLLEDVYDAFFTLITDILEMCYASGTTPKLAIMFQKTNLIQKVYEDLSELYPDKSIGRFCVIPGVKDKAKELDADIILTTTRGFNKAVHVEGLECIINTVPLSSQTIIEQIVGRLRYLENKKTIYFDVTDEGFKKCKEQRTYRKKILSVLAKEAFKINL